MQHLVRAEYVDEDGERWPATVVDVPDVCYLQVMDDDSEFTEPMEPSDRTFCQDRVNDSDVAYVPLVALEAARRWKPAGRQPEEGVRCIVSAPGRAVCEATWRDGKWVTSWNVVIGWPTHWYPFPEAAEDEPGGGR